MSRANEWVEHHREGETFDFTVHRKKKAARVTERGELALSDVMLSSIEALDLARWILDTFEDSR